SHILMRPLPFLFSCVFAPLGGRPWRFRACKPPPCRSLRARASSRIPRHGARDGRPARLKSRSCSACKRCWDRSRRSICVPQRRSAVPLSPFARRRACRQFRYRGRERTALISQNGNAYEEGLSEGWNPIQAYWKDPSPKNRSALRAFLTPETTQWQYTHGAAEPERLSPDAWTLDSALLARSGNDEIQLDLFGDYKSNVALYPKFQEYFRAQRPPLLAVWGKNDPFFLPAG